MYSRFDFDADFDLLAYGRWRGQVAAVIRGKRGQQVLQEVRAALMELEPQRLVRGELCTEDGGVCVLGALALHRGFTRERLREVWLRYVDKFYDYGSLEATVQFAINRLHVKQQLAVELAELNDEAFPWLTSPARYEALRDWIDRKLGL